MTGVTDFCAETPQIVVPITIGTCPIQDHLLSSHPSNADSAISPNSDATALAPVTQQPLPSGPQSVAQNTSEPQNQIASPSSLPASIARSAGPSAAPYPDNGCIVYIYAFSASDFLI